ncbi:DUF3419 family protein [Neomegalonema sp.]|uniref:DUF3419 family protein n=1 Tax=Neomegalonema sp. TaxID=2039713 RepID=UPI0026294E54|nr:DUF3419 family protein [Neomegalonema sp.]MDD2867062.1 DUF3419 family protein [Neomegalonema sp.]
MNNVQSPIEAHAAFDQIRYAQLWEDADPLLLGLGEQKGGTLVSICSAGDNALALLLLDPARVVVADLSPAQLACLRIRLSAWGALTHGELLELFGSRPSARRGELLDKAARDLSAEDQAFWAPLKSEVEAHGLGGIGKFERYFRLFRRRVLPLAHSRRTVEAIFEPRDRAGRAEFLDQRWSNWRWRLLLKLFFSNFVMGRLGRDPAFFAHVEGSLSDHVARRLRHAAVDLDPCANPFLRWIFFGTHGEALPLPWRPESFEPIRERLDRIEIRPGPVETALEPGERADGYNLSDIFEYMPPEAFARIYASLLDKASPGARLVYWNMMAPRRGADLAGSAGRAIRRADLEQAGAAMDKAFFYSDFIVEEAPS